MNLEKGQRWKNKSTGMILEIMNPINGQCQVKAQGANNYPIGYISFWNDAFTSTIRKLNNEPDANYIFWDYLEGQDAPV